MYASSLKLLLESHDLVGVLDVGDDRRAAARPLEDFDRAAGVPREPPATSALPVDGIRPPGFSNSDQGVIDVSFFEHAVSSRKKRALTRRDSILAMYLPLLVRVFEDESVLVMKQ